MKKILITGANSYIGTSFENYIKQFDSYQVDTVDMIDGTWREKNFSEYDVVFHVAGLAHSDVGKVSDDVKAKYYAVNTDLTIETAKKAKAEGVGQFVFMSSMIVFGSKNDCINCDTKPAPDNFYGNSKLQADIGIQTLNDENFKVASIRPPMIYGFGSKGNFPIMSKFAKKTPVFPKYSNKRSVLYIENLCEFVRLIIDNDEKGYFYPQNEEYITTSDVVYKIALVNEKKLLLTKIFNPFIWIFRNHPLIKKVFGNMYYDKSMSSYKVPYNKVPIDVSIERTEGF